MTETEWRALCSSRLQDKIALCQEAWGLGSFESWDLDQDAGSLTLASPGGVTATCSVQIIGSLSESSGTWLWAWENESVVDALKQDALKVRSHAEVQNWPSLLEAQVEAGETEAWNLAALACELCDRQGAYRGPFDGGAVFVTFDDVRLSKSS